ncbi:hypothetical protein AB0P07_08130 [Streptomyces sp. NPDC085944]|uniref:hypothetical protein n=1 Tax=Streptomyces sp. NPDC085944 TaxID=3154962 RepID=UPI003427A178
MELHVALSLRHDATEAYRLAHAYRDEELQKFADRLASRAMLYGDSRTVTAVIRDIQRLTGEKSIPAGVQPVEDGATHRHPRPCEFPTVLPCMCVRPGHLPEASFLRARQRGRIGDYFAGVKQGHDDRLIWAGETW